MKRSYFTTLGMLGAFGILLAWYFFYEKQFKITRDKKEESEKQFVLIPKDKIQEIVLELMKNPPKDDAEGDTQSTTPVEYSKIHLKRTGEAWNLVAPVEDKSDQSAVTSLLSTLTTTKQDRVVDENPKDLGVFGLKDPRTKVLVVKDSKTSEQIWIGKKTPVGYGVYVKKLDQPKIYKASQSFGTSFEKTLKDFRNKTVLTWIRSDVGEVELSGTVNLVLKKGEKDSWTLARENLPADLTETNKLLNTLLDLRVTEFASEDGKDLSKFGLQNAPFRIVLTNSKDNTRAVLNAGQKDGKTYVKLADKPNVYEVQTDTWTKLSTGVDKYQNREVANFNRFEIRRVKIEREKEGLEFVKETSDWTLPLDPSLKIDTAKVDTLLTKIQDLRLARYQPTAAFPKKPSLVIRLFDKKDNQETEKMTLSFGSLGANEILVQRTGLNILFYIKTSDFKSLTLNKSDFLKVEHTKPAEDKAAKTNG